jgi:hypothetical protein
MCAARKVAYSRLYGEAAKVKLCELVEWPGQARKPSLRFNRFATLSGDVRATSHAERSLCRPHGVDRLHRSSCGVVHRHAQALARSRSPARASLAGSDRTGGSRRCPRICATSRDMKMDTIDPRRISRKQYEDKIEEVKAERARLSLMDQELVREQRWWEEGLRIFVGPLDDASGEARESTLRERIVTLLWEGGQGRTWQTSEVIDGLARRGWLPKAPSAPQMVRNRLQSMAQKRELQRDATGAYRLAASIWDTGQFAVEPELSDD